MIYRIAGLAAFLITVSVFVTLHQMGKFSKNVAETNRGTRKPLEASGDISLEDLRNPWPLTGPIGSQDPRAWSWPQRIAVDILQLEREELRLVQRSLSQPLPPRRQRELQARRQELEALVSQHESRLNHPNLFRCFQGYVGSGLFLARVLEVKGTEVLLDTATTEPQLTQIYLLSQPDRNFIREWQDLHAAYALEKP